MDVSVQNPIAIKYTQIEFGDESKLDAALPIIVPILAESREVHCCDVTPGLGGILVLPQTGERVISALKEANIPFTSQDSERSSQTDEPALVDQARDGNDMPLKQWMKAVDIESRIVDRMIELTPTDTQQGAREITSTPTRARRQREGDDPGYIKIWAAPDGDLNRIAHTLHHMGMPSELVSDGKTPDHIRTRSLSFYEAEQHSADLSAGFASDIGRVKSPSGNEYVNGRPVPRQRRRDASPAL